jgi:hypothetical protein
MGSDFMKRKAQKYFVPACLLDSGRAFLYRR